MSILIKGIPLGGYEISIMKDGERYRARVDGIWCDVEEIPTTDTDSDTISRAKAIDSCRAPHMRNADCSDFEMAIMMLPPAQPKRGKWEMGIDERFVKCSECGLMTTRNELRGLAVFGKNEPNFCPNCGADMREVTT